MPVISLCGWETFQHYRDRDPAWVKLHRNLLSSEAWIAGNDASRLVQVASILLAARYHNAIPMHPGTWKKVAGLDLEPAEIDAAIAHLGRYGFLEVSEKAAESGDASTMLAERYHDASLEREREKERDRKGSDDPFLSAQARARPAKRDEPPPDEPKGRRLPPDWQPEPLTDALDRQVRAKPEGWLAREEERFRDFWRSMAGADGRKADWNATWRNWLRRELDDGKRGMGRSGGAGSRQYRRDAAWELAKFARDLPDDARAG